MVDLTNLKVGDTVNLRCGGSIVVGDNLIKTKRYVDILDHSWGYGGRYRDTISPFDIISITPKPEPKRIKGWVNVYVMPGGGYTIGNLYKEPSKAEVDYSRVACIKIDVAEGEGL